MVRISNSLIGLLNTATIILSVVILGGGIWMSHRASTDCEKLIDRPLIAVGVLLLLVSAAGLAGSCCRNSCLLWLYLFVTLLLIVALSCFTLFAFVVTNKGAGAVVSGRGYKEYRLGDYSNWLQKRIGNGENWAKIRSCLKDVGVCRGLQNSNQTFDQLAADDDIPPIQSGCCLPPAECNFIYKNATDWEKPVGFISSNISDCNTWRNDQANLCLYCESCKAGVLANIKKDWKTVSVVNILFLIFLIVVYSVGCCAFRNNRYNHSYQRFKSYP